MRTLTTFFVIITVMLTSGSRAVAAEPTPPGCQVLYNGGASCYNSSLLAINKKILSPTVSYSPGQSLKDTDFIENIGYRDTPYRTNTSALIRIHITNTSRSTLKNIIVKEILPSQLASFVSGNGSFDPVTKTFTTTINEIKPQQEKSITVTIKTKSPDSLQKNDTPSCAITVSQATVNNKTSQDTSQICVRALSSIQTIPTNPTTKGGLPLSSALIASPGQKTPDTGPEALILAGLIPGIFLGIILRRKAV